MKPAPYHPGTLKRIRAGATPDELGWDSDYFDRICRKHEIEPSARARIAVPAKAPPQRPPDIRRLEPDASEPPPTDPPIWDEETGRFMCGSRYTFIGGP